MLSMFTVSRIALDAHVLLTTVGYAGLIASNAWLLLYISQGVQKAAFEVVRAWRSTTRLFNAAVGLGVVFGFGAAGITHASLTSTWLIWTYLFMIAGMAAQMALLVPSQRRAERQTQPVQRLAKPVIAALLALTLAYAAIISLMVNRPV